MSQQQPPATVTRREIAARFALHPDSVSRLLHAGLAVAVVAWSGRGKQQTFAVALVDRFMAAWTCQSRTGGCARCRLFLEDSQIVAAHLHATKHGHAGCPECTPPGRLADGCGRYAARDQPA
jgi:hypothetical protein